MTNNNSGDAYRERKPESDDEDGDNVRQNDAEGNLNPREVVKVEMHSPSDVQMDQPSMDDGFTLKPLNGLHLTFNLEAGSLLPLTIK